MLVAAGPLVTMATPGRPVTWAYPSAMCPAPCSWRTRMWRMGESMMGSYTGRIAPPGRPNMTSTSCISRLLMRAWAPVSFIAVPCVEGVQKMERPPGWEVVGARGVVRVGRALSDYYEDQTAGHRLTS